MQVLLSIIITLAAAARTIMFLSERHSLQDFKISRCWLEAADPIPEHN